MTASPSFFGWDAACGAAARRPRELCGVCSFRELGPPSPFVTNWHVELISAKLAAVRKGRIRRLIVSVPPRHLKSHPDSVAF